MNGSNPAEDLAVVRRLMEEARDLAWQHGKHFVVWGIIGTAALLLTYAHLTGGAQLPVGAVWSAALIIGWAFSAWVGWRDRRRARLRTIAGRMLGGIWLGFGVTASLIAVLALYTSALAGELLGGLMAALLGFGFFASSFVGRQGWLRGLALGWWGGAVALFLWPGPHTLPLLAGLLLVFQVAPGLVIHLRGRRMEGSAA